MDTAITVGIIIALAQMIYNALIGWLMFKMRRDAEADDTLRKEVKDQSKTIRDQVDAAVEQKIGQLSDGLARLEKRLERGDKLFQNLHDHDHKAELLLKDEVHQLKLYVTQHCSTKSEVESLVKQITALRVDIMRVETNRGGA